MKKTTALFASLLTAASFSATQAQAQGVRLGLKGGVNYTGLTGNVANKDRYDNKVGFHGGVVLNAPITSDGFFSIQPELLFSQKGFSYDEKEYTAGSYTYKFSGKVNNNYLELPLLAKINADGFYFEAGPQVGYLLGATNNVKRTINGTEVTGSTSYNDLDNAKRFEFGYAAGLGYQMEAGLMVGIRYNGSLTNIANVGYQSDDFKNARNSVFQASVGYLFGGK